MAHEVESMTFFGQLPWHGLGTALEEADPYDWPAASKKAGLDWEVELAPLITADTQAKVAHRAVQRTSDDKVLGVVGPCYAPLQNKDAFQWFMPFLDAKEAALHTAGSLRDGSRVWVLAKLNRDYDEFTENRDDQGGWAPREKLIEALAVLGLYPQRRGHRQSLKTCARGLYCHSRWPNLKRGWAEHEQDRHALLGG